MSKNILIVDDSASMRQLVTFALEDAGYDVVQAVDGEDALSKAGQSRAEMVITDLNMPKLDGIGLIRQLRERSEYKFTPIVMLTTESQDTKKKEGKQAGASGWIVKPFTPDQLIGVVRKFIK
ncbi:MAG: response regulator [Thermodesulfovibrionales bacterium]|nr:response regulator [Thermodesulfovibrionales bacterium]